MKFNIFFIVFDHIQTLRDLRSERVSLADLFFFYVVPMGIAALMCALRLELSPDVYHVGISVFSIFCALLFSAQIAMYGVFKASRRSSEDVVIGQELDEKESEIRKLIKEINTNISYLILISFFSLTIFISFVSIEFSKVLESSIFVGIFIHFLLTILMVLKRTHAVFDSEYSD